MNSPTASHRFKRALIAAALILFAFPAVASAALKATPPSHDWGEVDRYQQSWQQNFKFTNGEDFGVFPRASLSGPDADQFALAGDGCSGQFLPAGSSCDVAVYVDPRSVGPLAASLDLDDGSVVAAVPLRAAAVTGRLSVNPSPVDFDPQPWFYGSQNYNVDLQAQGFGVEIADVTITGPDRSLFSINYGNCAGTVLSAWNGCNLGVGFNPTGPTGPASASLEIASNGAGSPQTVAISADALSGPDAQITPVAPDFGPVAVGAASPPMTFTLTNAGDFPDQIQQVFPVSGSARSFPVSADGCTMRVVLPGEACTFDISFAPAEAGAKEASIFVISSGPAPVTQVGLSGQGYDRPGVAAVIGGTPEVGRALDCEGINANGELSFRWLRDGSVIDGATKPAYELEDADFEARIGCRITASNPVGTTRAESPRTPPVAARDLSREPQSLVDEAACRYVAVDAIRGVRVSGVAPATPDSPLTFEAAKRVRIDLGGIKRTGRRVRFNPRRLSELADGPVPLSVDGRARRLTLAPCALSGRVSGVRGGSATYAISGRTAIRSASMRTPDLAIKPRRGAASGRVSVFRYERPTMRFPLNGRRTSYNGMKVALTRHAVKVRGLMAETSTVRVNLLRGVVRGGRRGGDAMAKADLQGTGKARATFSAAWRR